MRDQGEAAAGEGSFDCFAIWVFSHHFFFFFFCSFLFLLFVIRIVYRPERVFHIPSSINEEREGRFHDHRGSEGRGERRRVFMRGGDLKETLK